jgi:deoxyadenosine/deoxycytidine kinase
MPKIIQIEGNIGVGKSTFTQLLKDNIPSSEIVSEPVDMWLQIKNFNDKNILQMFYDDTQRWAYTFQNIAYVTRMMKIERTIRNSFSDYIFLDRSIETDRYVFEKMLWEEGKLQKIEHEAYELWCNFYQDFVRPNNSKKIIYLRCSPEVCAQRIQIRGREEEKSITIDYLNKLHLAHEDWLFNKSILNSDVLVLDCTKDFEHDFKYRSELLEQVKKFIQV